MAFSKEIKGRTVMFTRGAAFIEKLDKLYTVEGMAEDGSSVRIPAGNVAISQLTALKGEVDRDTLEYYLSLVAFAMQIQLKRDEFINWISELDDSELIEFAKKVKAELDNEKKLLVL